MFVFQLIRLGKCFHHCCCLEFPEAEKGIVMEHRKDYGFYYSDNGGHLDIEAVEDFSYSNGLKDDI